MKLTGAGALLALTLAAVAAAGCSAQQHLISQQRRRARGRPGHCEPDECDRRGTAPEQRRGLQRRAPHPAFAPGSAQVPADRGRHQKAASAIVPAGVPHTGAMTAATYPRATAAPSSRPRTRPCG